MKIKEIHLHRGDSHGMVRHVADSATTLAVIENGVLVTRGRDRRLKCWSIISEVVFEPEPEAPAVEQKPLRPKASKRVSRSKSNVALAS